LSTRIGSQEEELRNNKENKGGGLPLSGRSNKLPTKEWEKNPKVKRVYQPS